MSLNVNDFRDFVLFEARKAQSGGITPRQFNLAMERAFVAWVMKRYGNALDYQPGQPIPRVAWQQTQKISDDLRFLLTKLIFTISQDGKLNYPDGSTVKDVNSVIAPKYLHASSFRFNFIRGKDQKEVKIEVKKDSELSNTLGSSIVMPTKRFPKCAYYDTFIEFWPKDLQRVIFTYLREPKIPKWAFTDDANGRPVYDAANSIDIESGIESINEIAFTTLAFMGISIRDPLIYQAGENYRQTGL